MLTGEKPDREWRAPPALIRWNWPAGTQLTVRAVTNCDEVELFLNDHSLGRHVVSHDIYASDWTVAYAPGVLSAIAYRAGHKIAAQEIRTAGGPARLQLTPLVVPINSDLALCEITVVDDAGLTVTDATPAVKVQVEGDSRLVGLDSGDLDYGGLFKTDSRFAYQGRLLAAVQRAAPGGLVRISATAPGLPAATALLP